MAESTYKTIVHFTAAARPTVPYGPNSGGGSRRAVCVGDYQSCTDAREWWETEYGCQCAFVEPVNPKPSHNVFD